METDTQQTEYVWEYIWYACGHRSVHMMPFSNSTDGVSDREELKQSICTDCWIAIHGDVDSNY